MKALIALCLGCLVFICTAKKHVFACGMIGWKLLLFCFRDLSKYPSEKFLFSSFEFYFFNRRSCRKLCI